MAERLGANPAFYRQTLAANGPTAKGVGWGSEYTQRARLDILAPHIGKGSVLDVGCGCGALCGVLGESRRMDYLGIDALAEMIQEARRQHPGWSFWPVDVRAANQQFIASDHVVASGLFAFADDAYLLSCVRAMLAAAKRLVAFNVLTRGEAGEYIPGEAVLREVCGMGRHDIITGYLPNDQTIVLWRTAGRDRLAMEPHMTTEPRGDSGGG